MSENPLTHILSQSIQASGFSEAIKHIWSLQSLIPTLTAPSSHIDFKVLTLLNRLQSKYSSQIYLPLSRLYLSICKIAEPCDPAILIKLSNDVLMLCESIKNTEIAEELQNSIQHLLTLLSKSELEPAQTEVVQSLLTTKDNSIHNEQISEVCQNITKNKVFAVHDLFDIFSGFGNFNAQVDLFIKKVPEVVEAAREVDNAEIIKKLLVFLEHFVFKFNYNVQIGEICEVYSLSLVNKIKREMLDPILKVVHLGLTQEALVIQSLLPILQRLWLLFPQDTESLYDATRVVLTVISTHGSSESKAKASGFLYDVLNTPGFSQHLKDSLEDTAELAQLIKSEAFSPSAAELESEISVKLEELQPFAGLPLNAVIPAGEEYYHCVEIIEANSILTWGFATKQYDITFELIRIDLPIPQVVFKQANIICTETPFVKSKLINSPGLYKFVWSNKSSWFNSKHVRFRALVLTPYHKANITEKDLHKVIEILCDDHISSISKDILEVAVVCKSKTVVISALGTTEEIPDLDVYAVQGFAERITNDRKFQSVKFGIISKTPKKRNELRVLKAVAMCRDVDAIALLNESEVHCDTLICVMAEEGIRSCVMHWGKVLVDEGGTPVGDLSRAGITEIFAGISVLMSLFGPANVVIAGADAPSIIDISDKIKGLVPEKIIERSSIRATAYGDRAAEVAASKLHYLSQKYRINS